MSSTGLRRRGAGAGGDGSLDDDADGKRGRKARISLESFDLYQKVHSEESVQTASGATLSVVSLVAIAILLVSQLGGFLFPKRAEHMVVDPVVEGRLRINFDITFPALSCADANIDAMDVAGEQQNGLDHDVIKTRLDGVTGMPVGDAYAVRIGGDNATAANAGAADDGHDAEPTPLPANYCGSCFGAERESGQCCNTCDDLRAAYAERGWDAGEVLRNSDQCLRDRKNPGAAAKEGEGCRIAGFMMVNKVAGNFHIAMGETHQRGAGHIHQFNPATITRYNVSHTVHSLSFGLPYPGQHNPLDGVVKATPEGAGVYMYYIKVRACDSRSTARCRTHTRHPHRIRLTTPTPSTLCLSLSPAHFPPSPRRSSPPCTGATARTSRRTSTASRHSTAQRSSTGRGRTSCLASSSSTTSRPSWSQSPSPAPRSTSLSPPSLPSSAAW
jgi:hypothetical protein